MQAREVIPCPSLPRPPGEAYSSGGPDHPGNLCSLAIHGVCFHIVELGLYGMRVGQKDAFARGLWLLSTPVSYSTALTQLDSTQERWT